MKLSRQQSRLIASMLLGKRISAADCGRWSPPICAVSQQLGRLRRKYGNFYSVEYKGEAHAAEYYMTRGQQRDFVKRKRHEQQA